MNHVYKLINLQLHLEEHISYF